MLKQLRIKPLFVKKMELLFIFAALFQLSTLLERFHFVGLLRMMTKNPAVDRCKCFVIMIISFFREYVLSFSGLNGSLTYSRRNRYRNSGSHCFQVNKNRGVSKKVESDAQTRNDIALTPLAIPMLAGPGSISC
jgi:multiple antibiotic resistance protein